MLFDIREILFVENWMYNMQLGKSKVLRLGQLDQTPPLIANISDPKVFFKDFEKSFENEERNLFLDTNWKTYF